MRKVRYVASNSELFADSEKPEEWDDEEDGDWIAPTIRNPKCDEAPGCGEWKRYVYLLATHCGGTEHVGYVAP